ncbi:MAG: AAA family ATPase [Desulfobacterales bacterium]
MSDNMPEFIRAMQSADFFPHAVDQVSLRETHISWVILTGPFVYKIKKPVDLDFLDFSTLEKREHYCRREVELNRRLTSDIYLGVVAITHGDNGFQLDGEGETVETAVKMRQLASRDSLAQRLQANGIDPASIDRLACKLVRFYDGAQRGPDIDRFGSLEVIARNCTENFRQIAKIDDDAIDHRILSVVEAATSGFLDQHRALFAERLQNGHIRDGHGDLRSDHVYLTREGVQIIDCIEFNDRFRYGDVASDLAFLSMELDHQGHHHLAGTLTATFVRHSDDHELSSLLDFYKCYRAMVRLKVTCLRLRQTGIEGEEKRALINEIRRYTQLAYRYAVQFSRPTLWVVCGMMATGKSTVARALADCLHISTIRSDVVRKQLFKSTNLASGVTDFEAGIYSRKATALTYGRLLREAQAQIEKGRSVILDATFSHREQRREAMRLAQEMAAWIVFVQCTCSETTIRKRLLERTDDMSVSDARVRHLDRHTAKFEEINELSAQCLINLNTEKAVAENLGMIIAYLARPHDCLAPG